MVTRVARHVCIWFVSFHVFAPHLKIVALMAYIRYLLTRLDIYLCLTSHRRNRRNTTSCLRLKISMTIDQADSILWIWETPSSMVDT
jgi:hypothetical protein